MAEFLPAFERVLADEGGDRFVNDPADAGGATRYGISLRFIRTIPNDRLGKYGIFGMPQPADIAEMTEAQARLIYEWEFWLKARFEHISDQDLCNYVFSACVLHGTCQGIKLLQRALWAVCGQYRFLLDDGVLGNDTLHALGIYGSEIGKVVLKAAIMAEHAGLCRMLANNNPRNGGYLNGWLARCYRW